MENKLLQPYSRLIKIKLFFKQLPNQAWKLVKPYVNIDITSFENFSSYENNLLFVLSKFKKFKIIKSKF